MNGIEVFSDMFISEEIADVRRFPTLWKLASQAVQILAQENHQEKKYEK